MTKQNTAHSRTATILHAGWYTLGALIPIVINIIKTPILTRHYPPGDFGRIGLVMASFSLISILIYSWLASNLWRYYHQYHNEGRLHHFYSNILIVHACSSAVLLLGIFVSMYFFEDALLKKLICYCALQTFLKELIGLYFIVARLNNKSRLYNIIMIFEAVFSFVILLLLCFVAAMDISSLLLSMIIADAIILLFTGGALYRSGRLQKLSIQYFDRNIIKTFAAYGFPTLIASLFLVTIAATDRYIIALFDTLNTVGIYSKNYDIAQLSIYTLILVFFNVTNPKLIKTLENNRAQADALLKEQMYFFILLVFPATLIAAVFSGEINTVLLGENFRSGVTIMPYIVTSIFILGMIKFYEIKFKFENKQKTVALYFFIIIILNILLKVCLVAWYGYQWAAISLLISSGLLLCLFVRTDASQLFRYAKYKKRLPVLLTLSCSMVGINIILRHHTHYTYFTSAIELSVFAAIYIFIFYKEWKPFTLLN